MPQPSDVKPGEGAILSVDGEDLAVYNDGKLKAASAICTHMGCTVGWNAEEKTFDCPCHGSRYRNDFSVLNGPAEEPLEKRKING
jgi:Rieske Fe-S protein